MRVEKAGEVVEPFAPVSLPPGGVGESGGSDRRVRGVAQPRVPRHGATADFSDKKSEIHEAAGVALGTRGT